MKLSVAALLAIPALVSAFSPSVSKPAFSTRLQVTADEDLELTRKVILDHIGFDEEEKKPAPKAKVEEKEDTEE